MVSFDTIPKDRLMKLITEHISDSRMLKLIKMFLDQSILEELREWTPIAGVPQRGLRPQAKQAERIFPGIE